MVLCLRSSQALPPRHVWDVCSSLAVSALPKPWARPQMLVGAKTISLGGKNPISCFGGAAGPPAQKILGPKLRVLSPTRTAVTSELNLLGKK